MIKLGTLKSYAKQTIPLSMTQYNHQYKILDKKFHIEMVILREMNKIAVISYQLMHKMLTPKPSLKILGFISEPKESSIL